MHELPAVILMTIERMGLACVVGGFWIVLTWAALRAVPKLPANWRVVLWWVVTLKLLLLLLPMPALELAWLATPPQPSSTFQQLTAQLRASARLAPKDDGLAVILAILWAVWGLGVLAHLGFTAAQWYRLHFVLKQATRLDPPSGAERLSLFMERLRLTRLPQLVASTAISSPLATGWRRQRVVLPSVDLQKWSVRECELALAHELAHHKRRDLIWALVPWLARTLFWFHPLVWLAAREHRLATEQACDALALRACQASPNEYGRWLLSVAPIRLSAGWLSNAAAAPHFRTLRRRLAMLENQPSLHLPTPLFWLSAALAATAILVPVRVVAAEQAPVEEAAAEHRAPAKPPSRVTSTESPEPAVDTEVDRLREQIARLASERTRLAELGLLQEQRIAPDRTAQRRLAELARRFELLAERQAQQQLRRLSEGRARTATLAAQLAEERARALAYTREAMAAGPSEELY